VWYRWPGIVRSVVILACLVGLGIAGYFQVEHLILRAQLRRMNHKLAVLEQKLEQYEAVARFLNDPASARILESLAARTPDSVKR
jgi:Tfp pilus assembly protein PilN